MDGDRGYRCEQFGPELLSDRNGSIQATHETTDNTLSAPH
jgi:hypothetical protein